MNQIGKGDIEKAKTYLQKYEMYRVNLANKLAEIQTVTYDVAAPAAVAYDKDNVQTSADGDGMLRIFEQLQKRKKKLENEAKYTISRMKAIEEMVDKLQNPKHKRLIHLYYIEDLPNLEQVAKVMNYSPDHVKHMHGSALQEFANLLKVSTKSHKAS